ncbi:hypothetical protein HYC85_022608 [Camellia sinensis]|uniref:Pentatricopeptide repeat-containing protein n=1 Tax=Camellia sinensis TaxID=4442 RepID=A0A7J7GC60_CAMSI|nr:hypothetical protein HYC85_022608 [Camellia sinensis]
MCFVEFGRRVFDMVPSLVRDVSDCYANALKVFEELLGYGNVRPNQVTMVSALTACGRIGFLDLGSKVHGFSVVKGFDLVTSMISGYVQSDLYKDIIDLFTEMQVVGVKADSLTIACVISACGHSGALHQGRWVHSYCERNHIEMNLSVKNVLVDVQFMEMALGRKRKSHRRALVRKT